MLAPLVVVCLVAFTPENTLTLPTTAFSLRWFAAVFDHPDFVAVVLSTACGSALRRRRVAIVLAVPAGLAHRPLRISRPRLR